MRIFKTVKSFIEYRAKIRRGSIGFISTKGYIHDGHKKLVQKSLKKDKITIVSINPAHVKDDIAFNAHTRDIEYDLNLLKSFGVSAVFIPFYDEIFQALDVFNIDSGIFAKLYCSVKYPDIYAKQLTILHKFMHIVRPDNVYLGKCNYPLLFLSRAMVKAFFMPVKIEVLPTVRSPFGLPLSPYNAYLSEEDRERASIVYRSLKRAKEFVESEKVVLKKDVLQMFQENVSGEKKISVEYFEAASRINFMPLDEVIKGKSILLAAFAFQEKKKNLFVKGNSIRFTDNIEV